MSDRQLNSLWYNYLRTDPRVLLSQGYLYSWDFSRNLNAGGSEWYSLSTGHKPAVITSLAITTTGTRGVRVDFYLGGDITLGTPRTGLHNNLETQKPPPWVLEEAGFIDVPGALSWTATIGEQLSGQTGSADHPSLILNSNSFSYFIITNLHNQAADITFEIVGASIPAGGII